MLAVRRHTVSNDVTLEILGDALRFRGPCGTVERGLAPDSPEGDPFDYLVEELRAGLAEVAKGVGPLKLKPSVAVSASSDGRTRLGECWAAVLLAACQLAGARNTTCVADPDCAVPTSAEISRLLKRAKLI
jgi:hypothetical protein